MTKKMGWLDMVLSTPLIGVLIEPDFKLVANYHTAIAPLLNNMVKEGLKVLDGNFAMKFSSNTGYVFSLDDHNLIIDFIYNLILKRTPGMVPALEPLDIKVYSELLNGCVERMKSLTSCFFDIGNGLKIRRVGIMARTSMIFSDIPPGIKEFYNHLALPWQEKLVQVDTKLLVNLTESAEKVDRCHHHIHINHSEEDPKMDFVLDWQRVFSVAVPVGEKNSFENILLSCINEASEYFDRIGSGVL